jgi:hypothetical protein
MLGAPATPLTQTSSQNLKSDFLLLIANCFEKLDAQSLRSILKQAGNALPLYLTRAMASPQYALNCIRAIGSIIAFDDGLCTFVVANTPLLKHLPSILSQGNSILRAKTMWLLTNVICNGEAESKAVIDTGLVSNIALALRGDAKLAVQIEAMWALASLLAKLDDLDQLLRTYEIEIILLDYLRRPVCSEITMLALNALRQVLEKAKGSELRW